MSGTDEIVFLPLGGCGEVGMNLYLYGYGKPDAHKWLMVDLGVRFADESTPGIDLMMADPTFIRERREDLAGLVLTHGHEDHIGAVVHIWPQLRCPVYATPFTAALLREKAAEAGLQDVFPLTVVPLSGRFEVGPFDIEMIGLTHSILEPNALALRTPLGTVLHTGDWKIDPEPLEGQDVDEQTLKALGAEGVRAMICDSTNVLSPGHSGSERQVRDSLIDIIGGLKQRVAVTTFASNATRLSSIAHAARANGREVVLVGRAMHRIVRAAKETGYLKDFPETVPEEEAGYLPPEKALYLCTGSQAEPRAALFRIAEDEHPNVSFSEGDAVIFSSKIIPGNEVQIFGLHNQLTTRGIHVITEQDHFVHVSGHPCRDELAKMYDWVKPELAVPMHGEMRHLLEHRDFALAHGAKEAVVATNGSMVRLAGGPADIIERVEQARLFLDGKVLTAETSEAVQIRRRLAYTGAIAVTVVFDKRGELLDEPRVLPLGIPEELAELDECLSGDLSIRIEQAIDKLDRRDCLKDDVVDDVVRRAIRRPLRFAWGKRPLIDVDILRLSA